MYQKVKIVYYSGTGGTEKVAKCFERAFVGAGCKVHMQHLTAECFFDNDEFDLLIIAFAVHACNAPEPIYNWIEKSKKVANIPAVVISVSGGGEVIPNTACRLSTIKKLERKGYKVIYEKMLVMPSNWIVPTKKPLALMLLDVLPKKVQMIVNDIGNNVRRRTIPLLIDRIFSYIGELEKTGAKAFGKRIKVSEVCNGCGSCSRSCPAGNITMKNNKPQFGSCCQLCLGCIYRCPNKAIKPGIGRFIVIKEGYDLNELENELPFLVKVDVEKNAKGYLWSGVRKYLLECNE